MATVWVKTAKGKEEVERKTFGLAFKLRQVLIMIDGKRDLAALQSILPPEGVPGIAAELLKDGFIEATDVQASPVPASAMPASTASADPDEDPFMLGQTFMINMAKRILGVAGDAISAKLRAAPDVPALRALIPEWRNAIRQAPDGLQRLKELEKKLAKALGDT